MKVGKSEAYTVVEIHVLARGVDVVGCQPDKGRCRRAHVRAEASIPGDLAAAVLQVSAQRELRANLRHNRLDTRRTRPAAVHR
jgi:hypothetical protein